MSKLLVVMYFQLILLSLIRKFFSRKIDDKEKEAINFSKKNLEKFMCSIFDLSKKFRAENITKEHTTSNFSENTIFCIGDKGVGKTHLQNYMLSSYSKKFDEKKNYLYSFKFTKSLW